MENLELKKNYEYYLQNKDEILKNYKDKYIIIKNEKIFDYADTLKDAIQKAKKLETGTYIIQKCDMGDNTQIFHTRVRINA